MRIARNGLENVSGCLTFWVAVAIALAAAFSARAGTITLLPSNGVSPLFAAEVDELSKSIVEVNEAIKSFQKRDLDTCLQQLTKAVKAHPELPPAHALLAKLALLSNQIALVRPALETAVAQAPDHPEIYILFGNLALLENRATDAALHFEKAKALASAERWTADQRRRFERFCHQGNALLAESRGDWKAARSALEAWLALEPANARARQRLGKALFSLDQQDEAYKELQKASKEDSALEPADVMMGWLYTRAGNLKKAEEWMDYAAKTSPDSLPVQLAITSWLLEQGRADEAQSHAEAAAKLDSKSNQVQRLLGLVARERKEYGQSEAIFQALALESPGDAWVRNQLALVLAEQGDDVKRKRALELAELSVRQNPNALDSLVTLGTVYYRLKRLDDAEKVLQAVFNSGKANSDAAYILALVKSDSGHPDSAPALLKTALSAPGLFIYRKDAQQWLDRLTTKSSK
ncbi:MAG TPA: tetratricopeptide repeat protein [Isosphaeraceae bacterium]|nr:tetratricopeptide repeat protein [Isosphaeraceae bacterium]